MPGMRLEDVRLYRTRFELTGKPADPRKELAYELYGNNAYEAESRRLWLTVGVRTPADATEQPFLFDVAYTGLFLFDGEADEKIVNRCVEINCPAIIFPFVREMLADLTRRAGQPPIVLPVVNFVALSQKAQQAIGQNDSCPPEPVPSPKKPRKKAGATRTKKTAKPS